MLSPCRPHTGMQTRQAGGPREAEPRPSRSRSDITVGGGDRDNSENVSGTAKQGLAPQKERGGTETNGQRSQVCCGWLR